MNSSDDKDHTGVQVEDTEDKITAQQLDSVVEESTSPKQMAMKSIHDGDGNMKESSPHHTQDNDKLLETPIVPFDSVSLLLCH